jgi:hypothetical protein
MLAEEPRRPDSPGYQNDRNSGEGGQPRPQGTGLAGDTPESDYIRQIG